MHRLFRHFLAIVVVVGIFSITGTLGGLAVSLQKFAANPQAGQGTSIAVTWFFNFVFITSASLLVFMPVTSVADYLFTWKWPLSLLLQVPVLLLVLVAWLLPWSLFFGRYFYWAVYLSFLAFAVPQLVYWGVFRLTDRDFGN